jgi:Autotransporter beta-domain
LAEKVKGFALKKQVLLLSVAVAALSASPAFAQTDPEDDITTAITSPVATATANPDGSGTPADILLDTGGSITVTTSGTQTTPQAAVTINSNNSFSGLTATTISNNNTDMGVGIMADLTAANIDATNDNPSCNNAPPCHTFEGITEAGTITLTGTGATKVGLYLEGADPTTATTVYTFTGNIDMTGSTMTITGDTSAGIKIDSLAQLDGNLTIGTINLKTGSTTSTASEIGVDLLGAVYGDITTAGSVGVAGSTNATVTPGIGMDLAGAIYGNVTIGTGFGVSVIGSGAQGILLTGSLNPCDPSVTTTCAATSLGSLVNNGTISVAATTATLTKTTGNNVAGIALAIGGNIVGGIYNAGPTFSGDTVAHASISSQGIAPTVEISPTLEPVTTFTPIVIGVYTDALDPGFSFYNRGSITSSSSNSNDSTQAIFIGGGNTIATTTLTGGIFNSGTIQTVATDLKGATSITDATAITIGSFAYIGATTTDGMHFTGDIWQFGGGSGCGGTNIDGFVYCGPKAIDQAGLVNSTEAATGRIIASVGGAANGEAVALDITTNAYLGSIINQGLISAVATTTDPTDTTILGARAIVDSSGSLTFIENNGTIAAAASTLQNDAQVAIAIDLSADTEASAAGKGVLILDQATVNSSAVITGKILFGTGDNQVVDVEGVSTSNTAAINGDITFGGGSTAGSDQLIIGDFGTVTGTILSNSIVGVSVDVRGGGVLNLQNDAAALNVAQNATTGTAFHVADGGTLNLTVFQEFQSGIIASSGQVTFDPGANFNITYGSFVPSSSNFILISAPLGDISIDTTPYNQQLAAKLPFLFEDAVLNVTTSADQSESELVLHVDPKDAQQLGLSGYAVQMLPLANAALSNDDKLGAAFVNGITDSAQAQRAYNESAPDVSGGERAIAIALTDQSSGPVAARQRMLRMYGKQDGEVTLWGQEFAEFVSDPGDKSTGQTGFKDHGFGFVLGMDGGDAKTGWYGGAFSFYSGDVVEPWPRDSHSDTLWYMLTGYTDWRGKGLFLDTKADLAYMDIKSKRFIDLTIPGTDGGASTPFQDEADGHRPGEMGALGMTTGAILAYGSTTITPQLSIDGMAMREEGYTEVHPGLVAGTSATGNGKGMDLTTQSYYANSLRAFLGSEVREDLNFGDFFVQPDFRVGYRYDFLNDPTKLKFAYAFGNSTGTGTGPITTLEGPDPAQGNFVAGASFSATTDAWTLGASYDFIRGTNGATTQAGTIHLLGRI